MGPGFKDYYDILGVAETADDETIKRAYRELARKHHPDLNPNDTAAEDRFKDISEAYAVLSDKEKRKQYDQMRAYGGAFVGGAGAGPAGGGFSGGFNFRIEDLFGAGGPEGLFEQVFGARPAAARMGRRGANYEAVINIPLPLAMTGGAYDVSIPAGPGQKARVLSVHIPPGIESGGKLRLRGQGGPGQGGGPAGDLLLTVQVQPHQQFQRLGNNLLLRLPISVHEAAKGATIEVPTIDGSVELKIPPNARSGQKLRLRGKGARIAGQPGDQLVELLIQLPDALSKEQIKKLADAIPAYNPRIK